MVTSVMGGSCGRRRYGCSSLASRVLLRGVNLMGDIIGGGCTSAHRLAGAEEERGVSAWQDIIKRQGPCPWVTLTL